MNVSINSLKKIVQKYDYVIHLIILTGALCVVTQNIYEFLMVFYTYTGLYYILRRVLKAKGVSVVDVFLIMIVGFSLLLSILYYIKTF